MTATTLLYWPDDADGDALRQLHAYGFDFDARHRVDFHVDFDHWPPPAEFVAELAALYPEVQAIEPDGDDDGYLLFTVEAQLSYDWLGTMQQQISSLAAPYGGSCQSWGVPHDAGDDYHD